MEADFPKTDAEKKFIFGYKGRYGAFSALCDIVEEITERGIPSNNKWGVQKSVYWMAKLGLKHEKIVQLLSRQGDNNRFSVFCDHKKMVGILNVCRTEYRDIYFPKNAQVITEKMKFSTKPANRKKGRFGSDGLPAKKRVIHASITDETSDVLLALLEAAGLPNDHYMKLCKGILGECEEMTRIIGWNPATTRTERLGINRKRAPFFTKDRMDEVVSSFGEYADNVLSILRVPYAYQSDAALRLTHWWIDMLYDGVFQLAIKGKALKYYNKVSRRIHDLPISTIRRVIMEQVQKIRRARSKCDLPGIKFLKRDVLTYGYEIGSNKEGAGYYIANGSFRLSGLTKREVFICKTLLDHERKNHEIASKLAEKVQAADSQAS